MKHLNLKHFKQLLLSLMALACVTTAYAQDANYDDFCKPTPVSKGGRIQIKGEILNATQLQENSPKTFTPTASSNNVQEWANTENEILAYPGAKFDLKVNFKPRTGFGSLTVFQLRSDETPSSTNRLYGLFKGDWQHMIDKRNETSNDKIDTESLFMEIEEADLSGVSVEYTINDENAATSATFPISIPENISAGQFVVIRFLICNITDSGSFDYTTEYDPCTSKASQVNYCDYIVRIVEKEQEGLEVTWKKPENGNITVKNGTEVLESPATVEPGTKLTIVPAPASGRYELGTLTANGTPITLNDGNYEVTINEKTVIAATFDIAKYQINWQDPTNGTIKVVYANDETQEVSKGSKVQLDTELKVIAEPSSSDYVLNRVYYVYGNGTEYDITKGDNGYTFTVQETTNGIKTIYINAVFEKVVKYRITWAGEETMQGNSLKVVYADTDEEVLNSETLVTEGSVLKIIPTTVPGYHLSALSYTISGLQNVPFTIGNEPYTFTVEGGTEDPRRGYFVIISADFTPDTYTLSTSVNPTEGGSVSVTTTDGATIEGSVTHGQTIVITVSENDGYKLQSLDVKGATKVDGQENQYTVEDNVTVTATFVEDAPVETWSEITLITMSANKPGDADVSDVTYNGEWVIQNSGASNEYGETFSKVHGPYIEAPQAGDYLAVKYNVPANAKYKFSFLSKRSGGLTEGMKLCYGKSLDALTDASDVMDIPAAGGNAPGIETESQTIDLEAGEYYFIYYITKATSKVRVADFRLYQLDGSVVEPTPEYTVTLNKPENGNLSVKYSNGEEEVTVSTEDATEPKTFNVAENTKLTVTVIPTEGYQLATLSPEMTKVEESENVYEYTVTEAVTIQATFKQIDTPVEKYTQDFGQGVGGNDREWTNVVFKTSSDNSKEISVNCKPNGTYNIYSDELISEENKVSVYPEETFELVINGNLTWIYTLAYIDWNGDGVFDEEPSNLENLGFNPATERDFGTNSGSRTYRITVPKDAKIGETRIRIVFGWKQTIPGIVPDDQDKSIKNMNSTSIDDKKNAIARDFLLNIKTVDLPNRTVTVQSSDDNMGKAVITGTEQTEITTNELNVSVTAIPNNGYMFINWTNGDEEVSSENPYVYNGSTDITLTANFAVKAYPTMKRKYEALDQQNRYLKEVVASVNETEQTIFSATSQDQLPYTKYVTAGEVTTEGALIDKTQTAINVPAGTETFDLTFKAWTEYIDGNEPQIVWTQQACYIDWNNDQDFDDDDEIYAAVGKAGDNNNFGDENGSETNGWTRTFNIPENVTEGTYRMRVVYSQGGGVTGWENSLFTSGKAEIINGVSYDFNIEVVNVQPAKLNVTVNKPVNGNLSVTYNNGTDNVTVSTDKATEAQTFEVAENTKLTVTVTPADGYQLATLSPEMTEVTDNENVYEYTVTTEDVNIEATFVEEVTFDYVPVPIKSGFNTDVIAEAKPSADHTSGTLDSEGWVLFTSGIQEEGALPLDLTTVDNIPYKMADVTSNNAAVLKDENTESTLVFKNPAKAKEVRLLSISAEGESTMEVTVNYDDDTNQTQSFKIADWWNSKGGQGEAYYGLDRIITENEGRYSKDQIDGRKQFRLFEQVVTTDPEKTIVSVKVVNKSTGTKTPSVLGVTVLGELLEVEPVMHSVTVKKPTNGDMIINYTVDGNMEEINTSEYKGESEDYSIPENTVLTITTYEENGYELEKLLPEEGMVEKTGKGGILYEYTVKGNVIIEAIFRPIQYGKVSAETPEEGSIEIQVKDPMRGSWGTADESFLEQVEFGTKLRAKVEANTGYNLVSVMKNQEELSTEEEGYYYFTVDAKAITISAEFEAQTFTLTKEVTPAEGGSVSVTVDGTTVEGTVKYGDVITVTVTENPRYKHESTVVEGAEEIDGQAGKYTVKGAVTITVTFTEDTSSINSIENGTVYYNAEEEVLYTSAAKSVRVYDLSGRLVLNAENQETVSLAELADGVYTAIVDGKIIKLNK